jgi:hypothetical protein
MVAARVSVGAYLASLMDRVVAASPGPLTTTQRRSGAYEVGAVSVRRPVATFSRRGDAALFVAAQADLRALGGAVNELVAAHRGDSGGRCACCGESQPCTTLRIIAAELAPRVGW